MQSPLATPYSNRLLALEASLQSFARSQPIPSPPVAEQPRRPVFQRAAPRHAPQAARPQRNRFLALEEQISGTLVSDRPLVSSPSPPRPQPNLTEAEPAFSYRTLNQRLAGRAIPNARSFSTVATAFARLRAKPYSLPHPDRSSSSLPRFPHPEPGVLKIAPVPDSSRVERDLSYQTLEKKLLRRSPIPVENAALDSPDSVMDLEGHSPQLPAQRHIALSAAADPVLLALPPASQRRPSSESPALPAPPAETLFSYRTLAVSLQQRKANASAPVSEVSDISDVPEAMTGSDVRAIAPTDFSPSKFDGSLAQAEGMFPVSDRSQEDVIAVNLSTALISDILTDTAIAPSTLHAHDAPGSWQQATTIDVTCSPVKNRVAAEVSSEGSAEAIVAVDSAEETIRGLPNKLPAATAIVETPIGLRNRGFAPSRFSIKTGTQSQQSAFSRGATGARALQRRLGIHPHRGS